MLGKHFVAGFDEYHVCDLCQVDDGRAALTLKNNNDFTLCFACVERLYIKYVSPTLKSDERLDITRRSINERERDQIFSRDHHACVQCGETNDLCIDHIVAFSRGGSTRPENLQTLCRSCNSRKGAQ